MLGLAVYVKEDFLWHAIYLQKTLRILTYVFDFDSYFTQCLTSFSSIDHLFRRYARFLTLFTVFYLTQIRFSRSTHLLCVFGYFNVHHKYWLTYSGGTDIPGELSSDVGIYSTMAFPPLENSDHVAISVSIDFPINSKQDAPFHNYSRADWDGLRDHLRDVPWEVTFTSWRHHQLVTFMDGFRIELMYTSLIVNSGHTSLISMVFSSLWCCHSS